MNFENLKEKLDKRYFKISEYFNDSFDIFKHLFKKEKIFSLNINKVKLRRLNQNLLNVLPEKMQKMKKK